MKIDRGSVRFYIGAATTGEGTGKWTWPGRDLPFLYELRWKVNIQRSLEPDLTTWKQFGLMMAFDLLSEQWIQVPVKALAEQIGDQEVIDLLTHCSGTYLGVSRFRVLDQLGCP